MTIPAGHDDLNLLVHAYLDGELDPVHAVEMERRLAADPALAAERDRITALRRLIGERLPPTTMPDSLLGRIEAAAGLRRARARPSWQAFAAAAVLAAVLASGATWLMLRPLPAEAPAELVVASHMRALMAPQPTDVSSSDRHAVKPWFNGRIPQSPRVVDLTDKGFPLVGGRIDVVGTRPAPTLVYRHRQHLISLIAVPVANGARTSARQTIAGYNVLSWRDDNTAYWAVSDLGIGDLEAFAAAFREAGDNP
ncbi:MAG TPA: anti-sigma factor [Xanthobacteraceae bacterium]|nr:anti-sigma factor [Xanthobacteraceae bacterium]